MNLPGKLKDFLARESARLRIVCLLGMVANPIWGLTTNFLYPEQTDPLWARLLLSGLLSITLYQLSRSENSNSLRQDWILLPTALAWTGHCFALVLLNGWQANQAANSIMVTSVIYTLFRHERVAWLYSILLALTVLSVTLIEGNLSTGIQLSLWTATSAFLGLLAIYSRHDIEHELADSEKTASLIVEHMIEGVMVFDDQGIIVSANPAVGTTLGYKAEELIGIRYDDKRWLIIDAEGKMLGPDQYPTAIAQREGKPIHGQAMSIQRPTGDFVHVEITAIPVMDPGSEKTKHTVVTIQDMTAARATEAQIKEQQAQIVHASHLSSLGEFASTVIHEISNPLSILGMRIAQLKLIVDKGEAKPGQAKENVEALEKTLKRVSDIIKNVRALSRGRSDQPTENVNLAELVRDAVESLHAPIQRGDVEIDNRVPDCFMNLRPGLILQVIVNLVGNAVYAVQNLDERWIRIELVDQPGHVELQITDSGRGIPPDVVARLMQPFFTTKPLGKGTGIGLSISRKIAAQHGGDLKYDALTGHTRFTVTLAKVQVQPEATAA